MTVIEGVTEVGLGEGSLTIRTKVHIVDYKGCGPE